MILKSSKNMNPLLDTGFTHIEINLVKIVIFFKKVLL